MRAGPFLVDFESDDMAVFFHRKSRFKRRLEVLRRGDKKSTIAASKADEIIKNLIGEDFSLFDDIYNKTKHGELRIDKCIKYDLGSGYRLICIEYGGDIFITYVGTHDDCDRWIENNRRFEPDLTDAIDEKNPEDYTQRDNKPLDLSRDEETDYDEILMKKIDQNVLRKIFCGLCSKDTD